MSVSRPFARRLADAVRPKLPARSYATEPTASSSSSSASAPASVPPPRLHTQLLLQRRPYLTPPTPEFLAATHAYTAHLTRALSAPLPENIYFKKGSLAARRFAHEEQELLRTAYGIEPAEEDAVEPVEQDAALADLLPRRDREDASGRKGTDSMERKGDRSVYVVVGNGKGKWRFPGAGIVTPAAPEAGEDVRGLAARAQANAHAQLGPNLSLWPVGRHPIAFLPSPSSSSSSPHPAALTFLFKAHLIAGAFELTPAARKDGWTEVAVLTKEEVGERVVAEGSEEGRQWWAVVEGLMNEY